jgi:hypothetical protein
METGFALVEEIHEDAKQIGALEAHRLVTIAQLYAVGAMTPLTPPPGAPGRRRPGRDDQRADPRGHDRP